MYVYNDEDNVPMADFGDHNPTVYLDRAEMRLFDRGENPEAENRQTGAGTVCTLTGTMKPVRSAGITWTRVITTLLQMTVI